MNREAQQPVAARVDIVCNTSTGDQAPLGNLYSWLVAIDTLDASLIALLTNEPRIGVLELSRRLRVARGTVQSRLDKLTERGVIRGFGPEVSPRALGFGVTAFVTLEIQQRYGHNPVAAHLSAIPEVLEAHTITGSSDLLCRIVARSNADLQRVLDGIVSYEGIRRASTVIALAEQIPYRTLPLVNSAAVERVVDGSADNDLHTRIDGNI
jgi:DNA-binding Lrp family transcriptional regulator